MCSCGTLLREFWRRAFVNAPDYDLCNYVIMFGRNQNVSSVQIGSAGSKPMPMPK